MKKQSRTVPHRHQTESPVRRHLPLIEILIDTQSCALAARGRNASFLCGLRDE